MTKKFSIQIIRLYNTTGGFVLGFCGWLFISSANCWRAQQARRRSHPPSLHQCERSVNVFVGAGNLAIISSDSLAESVASHAAEICSSHNLLFVQTAGKFFVRIVKLSLDRECGQKFLTERVSGPRAVDIRITRLCEISSLSLFKGLFWCWSKKEIKKNSCGQK